MRTRSSLCVVVLLSVVVSPSQADIFYLLDEKGKKTEKIEAQLYAQGEDVIGLLQADGKIRLISPQQIRQRIPKAGPKPITPEAMLKQLEEKFGKDKFMGHTKDLYVIGLVLAAPLKTEDEKRANALMRRAGEFMDDVDGSFDRYAKQLKLTLHPPEHPLVVLVFETDTDFEKYAQETTGGRGLSAGNIAGFYSGVTNWLAIRLSECQTFEVPLHEAIHQQAFNRKLTQRLAPIPTWFGEGLATAFEGDGTRVRTGPTRINQNFAKQATEVGRFSWGEVVARDRTFHGDVLAGEAYVHAWCMHWMLITQFPEEYTKYVSDLQQLPPLSDLDEKDRVKMFEKHFGKPASSIQNDFFPTLTRVIRQKRITFRDKPEPAGESFTQSHLGEVEMFAVSSNGVLQVNGRLRNVSPLRNMDFYVTVETDGGTYAEWYVPNAGMKKILTLDRQVANKVMRGVAQGGPSRTFLVRIRSTVPGSDEAKDWANGNLPRPVYRR